MKSAILCLLVAALSVLPLHAQQSAIKRHPGEHLHYTVSIADGDINKITGVQVHLKTDATARPDQQGTNQFGANCEKSSDPKIWTCDVVIPSNVGLIDGDYTLFQVSLGTPEFGQSYTEDFHVPVVPIQNPDTFTAPSKVKVSQP
jgi:hypothetical protein